MEELRLQLEAALTLVEQLEDKYTKANSKRLRAAINDLQKSAVANKKMLIETDKAQ